MDINVMLVYLSSTILGAGNDGTIWRWDQVSPSSSKTEAIQAAVAADANAWGLLSLVYIVLRAD